VATDGLQFAAGIGLAAWILFTHFLHGGNAGGILLLIYWVLNLPVLGQEAAAVVWQYPAIRNTALRFVEPLGAKEEEIPEVVEEARRAAGCAISMESVSVVAAGQVILQDVNLRIEPGSHVAIVGPSGAGKSSLAGLLLGWHRAVTGTLLVDGEFLNAEALQRLRRELVWVDPQVQLWNRSLFENIQYGVPKGAALPMDRVMETAGLASVVQKLPLGMQTMLGEGGALVSGGEGQRVRIARGAARENVRLVILDEPARGLDRESRQATVAKARELWKNATLVSISHDIGDTLCFPRVLVIDQARIAEDGDPAELAADPNSRYRQLLDAEETVRRSLWSSGRWRKLRLGNGKLEECERAMRHNAS
jgi:ATP-binding cassette subfamily B protein